MWFLLKRWAGTGLVGALIDWSRYTSPVERQLKERLIGAAVLIAIVVILVPEMFSGSPRTPDPVTSEVVNAGQLKTYQIDLQASSVTAPQAEAEEPFVEPPSAEPVLDPVLESQSSSSVAVVAVAASSIEASASSSSSSSNSSASHAAVVVASQPAVTAAVPTPANDRTGRWSVQIGSFSTQVRAQQIVAKLKTMGFVAAITPIKAGGKTLYRVRTGGLAERAAADSALKKIKTAYPDASVVPLT